MAEQFLPDAIDLSHHLSELSKNRTVSPLKGLQKYLGQPGLIQMAGGTPHPAYFPYAKLSGDVLAADSFPAGSSNDTSSLSWFWNLFSSNKKEKTTTVSVPKYPEHSGDLNLAVLLQYSQAKGIAQLQDILKEYVSKVYRPAYGNWTVLVNDGNTDGYSKAFITFCNSGDGVLVSEWTYPSALSSLFPAGVKTVPVGMDSQGMSAISLRKILEEWDEGARGLKRPRVIYTVPIGQNPTGTTMEAERKKEIYAIAVEFDLIIVEDDPYYILQFGEWSPQAQRGRLAAESDGEQDFIESLAPSYLRFDYQGRVVRLDTFSKTVAPGCRLGWFTTNPLFAERLERQGETTTQAPSGFSQSMVTALLLQWHYDGYIRWLRGIRLQYAQRRDQFIDLLAEQFNLRPSSATESYQEGALVLAAFPKPARGLLSLSEKTDLFSHPYFSFIPPSSGMFLWIKLHFEHHPSYKVHGYKKLEQKLWVALAENQLIFSFGSMFSATPVTDDTPGDGHFRISFSTADPDEMKKAAVILEKTLRKFYKEEARECGKCPRLGSNGYKHTCQCCGLAMVGQSSHNPFRANAISPAATGNSAAPSFHSIAGDGETTVNTVNGSSPNSSSSSNNATSPNPPALPPRRSTPIIEELEDEPPAYTPAASSGQGETTLEYGPHRPFQNPPQPIPGHHNGIRPQQTGYTQHLPQQPTGSSDHTSPRWLNDLTRNRTVHQAFGLARQITGDIIRQIDSPNSGRPSNQNNTPYQPSGHLTSQNTGMYNHSQGAHSAPYITSPPPLPPRPEPLNSASSAPPPQSEFAREFYSAGTGEGDQGDARGSQAYAPPEGPPPARQPPMRRRSRSVEQLGSSSNMNTGVPDDGRPTTTPMPGHPLLHKGSILVYPKGHFCDKCQNTGYKHFDPSHPCRKCWSKHSKNYEGAVAYADFTPAARASESGNKTFQRPLPSFGGSLSTIAAPRPLSADSHRRGHSLSGPHPPRRPLDPPRTPFNGHAHSSFGGPMRPWSPWGSNGPPVHVPPPRPPPRGLGPGGPGVVFRPGDPRIGGNLCFKCQGRGLRDHLFFEEECSRCKGIGRVF